ncbi:hypothetical protein PybrP1_009937 [[Pythium] brassicae (nom. inval.)]|nr:hypothetical protein PybrP1_009937 [[Pythium] brassicae (nom. inval.)]
MATSPDAVFQKLKATSSALRKASKQNERKVAWADAQEFLQDDAHRQLVHKWRAWGLLLSSLLHAVRCDAQVFLNARLAPGGSGANAKKKPAKSAAGAPKTPTTAYWAFLRNEFAALHARGAAPLLHLDANGRACLRQLFDFAVTVIGREPVAGEDADAAARFEEEAWRSLRAVVPFRVYCAVVDPLHLQDVLELALASLEHGRAAVAVGVGVGVASSAVLRAEVVQLLLQHCPFDLHALLPRLLEFVGDWFSKVGVGAGSGLVRLRSVEDVARPLLAAVVHLLRAHGAAAALPAMRHGVPILHFVLRAWKSSAFRARVPQSEFVTHFLALFARSAPEILVTTTTTTTSEVSQTVQEIALGGGVTLNPTLLLKTLKALLAMLLSPKEVQALLLHARLARGGAGGSNSSSGSVGVLVDLEAPIVGYLRCAADVAHHHDRLVAALVESSSSSSAVVGAKRERPVTATLAWETVLLENICAAPADDADADADAVAVASVDDDDDARALLSAAAKAQTPPSRDGPHRPAAQKQHVSWLLLVLAVLSRHGAHYVANRIGDVMTVMDQLLQLLDAKDVDQRQYVALSIFVQLSHLAATHADACGDDLNELWQKLWRCLLRPDLPYAHATESAVVGRDSAGDVVLHLLTNCVVFGLVPPRLVAETQARVWSLPAFRASRAALLSAARAASSAAASITPVRLLTAVLRCVELHDGGEAGDAARQHHHPSPTTLGVTDDDGGPQTLRAGLLTTLFTFLDVHLLHEAPHDTMCEAASVSPVAYASAVLAFLQPAPPREDESAYFGDSMVSKLLRTLSRSADDATPRAMGSELAGFGVHFVCDEDGLATLSAASGSDARGPHSFAPAIQEYLADASFQSNFYVTGKAASAGSERFEHVPLPTALLTPVLRYQEDGAFTFALPKPSHRTALAGPPSLSNATQRTMHREVSRHFTRLLRDIETTLAALGTDEPRATMRTVAGAMNVGVVLACLYTEFPRPAAGADGIDLVRLLQRLLEIVAGSLAAPGFEAALRDQSTAACAVRVLQRYHTFILLLQGKASLRACPHPSAEPVDLRFPSELRPSIRKVVGGIEAGLATLAAGDASGESKSAEAATPTAVFAALTGPSEWRGPVRSSQPSPAPSSLDDAAIRDTFDDRNTLTRASVPPTPLALRTISLWGFRVVLLLKKESGLKTVTSLATDVQFTPDFFLALATLLCGVPGADSLELLLKMVDYALDEAVRDGAKHSARRSSSPGFRAALFHSQVLTVLQLAARMHERRKLHHKEDVPAALVAFAKRCLDAAAADAALPQLRVARQAELECLEVCFRLRLDTFGYFVERAMGRLLDADAGVRLAAVAGIRSLFYMYPEGGSQLFKDLCHYLLPALPATCAHVVGDDSEGSESAPRDEFRDAGAVGMCVTVALALYVSACSCDAVVPEVLVVFVRLASSDTPLYASQASSFLRAWVRAIAQACGYATALHLLDDQFCFVWSQYLAISMRSSGDADDADDADSNDTRWQCAATTTTTGARGARELLEGFPMALFTGADVRKQAVADVFADKVDILLPVGVLYDSLDERASSSSSSPSPSPSPSSPSSPSSSDSFAFVHELVRVFAGDDDDADAAVRLRAAVEEQLVTDLFALAFVLQASGDPPLLELAARMLAVAEDKALSKALSLAHLGHVVAKMARFTIWDLARAGDRASDAERWQLAVTALKDKYAGFDWARLNLAELLCTFDALLLRAERSEPVATRAAQCFHLFVREAAGALAASVVLQQLVLRIGFQAIKRLAWRRKAVARRLTLLVREACDQFLQSPEGFGKYVGFVVHEIADILSRTGAADGDGAGALDADDKSHLEWVVFAVCNNMANGLGKFVLDIDAVPTGVSASLDKLNSLIVGSRDAAAPDDDDDDDDSGAASISASAPAKRSAALSAPGTNATHSARQLEVFVKKAVDADAKFYQQSRLIRSPPARPRHGARANNSGPLRVAGSGSTGAAVRALSTSLLRLAAVEKNASELVDHVGDPEKNAERAALVGRLTKTLFYLSSQRKSASAEVEKEGGRSGEQESDVLVAIANALSAVGALDRTTVDLSPGSDLAHLSRLHQEQFRRGALRETRASVLPGLYERTLVYLSALLFDERALAPRTLELCVVALKQLLRVDSVRTVLDKSKDSELKDFLNPFVDSPPATWSASLLRPRAAPRSLPATPQQHAQLWRAGGAMGFDAWVRAMTAYLAARASDPVLRECAALVAVRTEMAVFLFPYALWSVLRDPAATPNKDDRRRVATVVQSGVGGILRRVAQPEPSGSCEPPQIAQLLVHSLNFLREIEKAAFVESNGRDAPAGSVGGGDAGGPHPPSLNQQAYGCGLDVDLLDVARAAIRVEMPYSAMQYVEMWLEAQNGGLLPSLSAARGREELDADARRVLVDAYRFDADVDGLYGINDGRSMASQLVTYNQEGSFAKALPIYDVLLHHGRGPAREELQEGMLRSLRHLGYDSLLQGYLISLGATRAAPTVSPQIAEYKYELAWKSLQWGAVETSLSGSGRSSPTGDSDSLAASASASTSASYCHQKVLFQSLKALAHRDSVGLRALLHQSKEAILKSVQLSLCGLESTRGSYQALLWLESIRDIEEASALILDPHATATATAATAAVSVTTPPVSAKDDEGGRRRSGVESARLAMLFAQWETRYPRVQHDFASIDSLLALQAVLLTLADARNAPQLRARLQLSLARFSRKANRVAVAYSALAALEQLLARGQLGPFEAMRWTMEKAKLLWTQQETRSAIWTAKLLCGELERALAAATPDGAGEQRAALEMLLVSALTVTGKWLASQRSENSQVILDEYFARATGLVDRVAPDARAGAAAKAHLALADFMADMHQQVHARVTSRAWLARKRVAEARHAELHECHAMPPEQQLANRAHIHALNKEVQFDAAERARVEDSVDQFLTGALRSYGKGLALSPKAELAVVFRLLSLWFGNQREPDTNRVMADVIAHVPSYKLVPLSYQIMSRIGASSASLSASSVPSSSGSASRSSRADASSSFQRVLRALVIRLCEQHPHHALVQLLALKNSGDVEGKGALEFRANAGDAKAEAARELLGALRRTGQRELLESLDILSRAYIQLALFDTRAYNNSSKAKKIALAKVPITGLGGPSPVGFDHCLRDRTRRGTVNRAVMPGVLTCSVAPRADGDYTGVVVRVQSFEPLFAITDSGIHRPKIVYCFGSDGRRFKQLVKGKDDTRQDLVIEQAFETVNHFLAEDAAARDRGLRLRTYKVVPLSPIAGVLEWVDKTVPWGAYLVGRTAKRLSAHERYHPHEWKHLECRNALKAAADKPAAYAEIERHFTPVFHHFFLEKFPDPAAWHRRRLAFVQSAATTLQLLRKKSASVVTILEVFVHDPLYRWTLSPLKALKIQEEKEAGGGLRPGGGGGGSSSSNDNSATNTLPDDGGGGTGSNNDAAARALIRVKQKLEGYEDPNGNALSIEGQVKQLISAAQDPHNLCNLFPGWAPWL